MDVIEAIYGRRATRDFTDRPVDEKLVRELIGAAQQAPSAMNLQPWAFAVIQDRSLLRRYSERAKALCVEDALAHAHPELQALMTDPCYNVFYNAGTLIVIFVRPAGKYPDRDGCFAAQNLMLAAHAAGLATCPIGLAWSLFDEPDVRAELSVPPDYHTVLPIIVGYPAHPVDPVPRAEPVVLSWKRPAGPASPDA